MFSKTKVAPKPSKTLPTLKLLALYWAIQCFLSLIKNKKFSCRIGKVKFWTDGQVVFSWLLTRKMPKKNVFVINRIKNIGLFEDDLTKLGVTPAYKYIPTAYNIADILTLAISSEKYIEQRDL